MHKKIVFLIIDAKFPASDPGRFRKNLLPYYQNGSISLKLLKTKLKQIKFNMI